MENFFCRLLKIFFSLSFLSNLFVLVIEMIRKLVHSELKLHGSCLTKVRFLNS